jgi:hypothetical protein
MEQIDNTQIRSSEVRWEWIGHAWKMFTSDPGTWILMQLTIYGLLFIFSFFMNIVVGLTTVLTTDLSEDSMPAGGFEGIPWASVPLIIIFSLIHLVGSAFLYSGYFRTAIKQARGQAISLADLFSGRDCFLSVLGFMLLVYLMLTGVFLIFFLPSFVSPAIGMVTMIAGLLACLLIMTSMFFALPLIVDRKAGIIEAMRQSIELTRSHLLMYTLFAIIVGLLGLSGFLLCLIGFFITSHFLVTVPAVAYRDVIGLPSVQSYDQFAVPPPPTYSGIAPQEQFVSATPPQDQIQNPVVCKSCGATLLRATNFCNQCGSKL